MNGSVWKVMDVIQPVLLPEPYGVEGKYDGGVGGWMRISMFTHSAIDS